MYRLPFQVLAVFLFFGFQSALAADLFSPLPQSRSLENLPSWVAARTRVSVNDELLQSPSFTVSLPAQSPSLRSLDALQTGGSSGYASQSGGYFLYTDESILFDEEGKPVGNASLSQSVGPTGERGLRGHFELYNGESFSLTPDGAGNYRLDAIDQAGFPPCAGEHHEHPSGGEQLNLSDLPQGRAENGPAELDVMVVYTADARAEEGGTEAMLAAAEQAISLANTAYENSGAAVSLNLVYTGELSGEESSSFSTNLNRISTASDGYFDEVDSLRGEYYADMVVLMVAGGEYCGIGWYPTTLSSLQAGYLAFSVVSTNCISYHSFAHEIGHNLGLRHDVDNAPSSAIYEEAYGHHWNSNTYRSIMAYAPGTRVNYFSNPDVSYQGGATGTTARNSASVLNLTAPIAADYYDNPAGGSGGEEEEGEEEESGSGGGGSESGGGSEVSEEVEDLAVTLDRSKRRVTLTITGTDSEGSAVSAAEVTVYQRFRKKRRRRTKTYLYSTDVNGQVNARLRLRGKKKNSFTIRSGSVEERIRTRVRSRRR